LRRRWLRAAKAGRWLLLLNCIQVVKAATTAAADYVRQRVNIYMCAYKCADTGGGGGAAGGRGHRASQRMYMCDYNVYVLRRCAGYLTYPTTNSSVCRLLLLELQKLNSSARSLRSFYFLCAPRAQRSPSSRLLG